MNNRFVSVLNYVREGVCAATTATKAPASYPFETELHKVATCLGRLLRPQLDVHVAEARVQQHFAFRVWLSDVDVGHVRT